MLLSKNNPLVGRPGELRLPFPRVVGGGRGGGVAIFAPVNTVAPAITGTETEGETLTCSTGTWTGAPTSYAYQWWRGLLDGSDEILTDDDDLFLGVEISGATSSTHELTSDDADERLYCEVTATNALGSTMAQSNATELIEALGSFRLLADGVSFRLLANETDKRLLA